MAYEQVYGNLEYRIVSLKKSIVATPGGSNSAFIESKTYDLQYKGRFMWRSAKGAKISGKCHFQLFL